jgi:uncharacterized membrane protein YeiH
MYSKIVRLTTAYLAVACVTARKIDAPTGVPKMPESSMLDTFKPLLLADAPLWWGTLFGYALAVAIAVQKSGAAKNFYQGWVLTCLTGYGGGTLVPMLCGKPGVLIQNEAAVPMALIAWSLVSYVPQIKSMAATLPGAVMLSLCFETFRCTVMMNCANMAVASLAAPKAYSVATIGPLICGMLGGVGGGFMPVSLGVSPLDNGLNWRMRSAFGFSIWMRALVDPTISPYITSVVPAFADHMLGRAFGIFVLIGFPLLSMLVPGFGNPLGANPIVNWYAGAKQKAA